MSIKELTWSKAGINNRNDNPFGSINTGFFDKTTSREYNNYLIKDYIEAEDKYMDSCAKIFGRVNKEYAFKRDEDLVWICSHCGYVHNGTNAPKSCPICGSARVYFGIQY